jgi:hypothetical protein
VFWREPFEILSVRWSDGAQTPRSRTTILEVAIQASKASSPYLDSHNTERSPPRSPSRATPVNWGPVRNVLLIFEKAWLVHMCAFGLYLRASNKHADVSLESRATKPARAGLYSVPFG